MSYSLTETAVHNFEPSSAVSIRLRPSATTAGRRENKSSLMYSESRYRRFSGVVSGCRLYSPMLGRWLSRDPIGDIYMGDMSHNIDLYNALFGKNKKESKYNLYLRNYKWRKFLTNS